MQPERSCTQWPAGHSERLAPSQGRPHTRRRGATAGSIKRESEAARRNAASRARKSVRPLLAVTARWVRALCAASSRHCSYRAAERVSQVPVMASLAEAAAALRSQLSVEAAPFVAPGAPSSGASASGRGGRGGRGGSRAGQQVPAPRGVSGAAAEGSQPHQARQCISMWRVDADASGSVRASQTLTLLLTIFCNLSSGALQRRRRARARTAEGTGWRSAAAEACPACRDVSGPRRAGTARSDPRRGLSRQPRRARCRSRQRQRRPRRQGTQR